MTTLINKIVRIISYNENYVEFLDKDLIIIDAYNKGKYYDDCMDGMYLCEFEVFESGLSVPFSLYECEFKIV